MAERDAPLPPALAERLAAAERDSADRDFDATSWAWMLILGALLPLVLIMAGWLLGAGPAT
ncbi:MAG: hypothetical protein JSR73_07560 [Proteobacteria bacterium]|nr:hypothetical protein [Pseudomonadota bacterium]